MKKIKGIMPINRTASVLLLGIILSITIATLAVADNENIFLKGWHAMTKNQDERQIIRLIDEKSDRDVISVAWSPDGKWIATTELPMQVTIWDASTMSIRHKLNQGFKGDGIDNITFSPDSQYLASGLSTINLWKVSDGSIQRTFVAPHVIPGVSQRIGVESLCFSPDGRMLVVAYNGEKQIVIDYRLADGKIAWSYEPKPTLEPQQTNWPPLIRTPLLFTHNGKHVILGTVDIGGEDVNFKRLSRILILDAATGKFLRSIDDVHVEAPTALTLSPDGQWVVTGTETGSKTSTVNRKTLQTVTVDNNDPVRIWNLESGKLVKELPVQSHVRYLVFSRDGKYLFGAESDFKTHLTLAVWDVASGKMVQEVRSNPGPLVLAVSPDGRWLAAACQGQLSIYEIMTGK